MQHGWFHPVLDQCPSLSTKGKPQYMRDINERNRARGVGDFWNSRNCTDVVTGAQLELPYTECQWGCLLPFADTLASDTLASAVALNRQRHVHAVRG